jgi:hypothetical protein
MNEEAKKEACCDSSHACCKGKKLIVGVLLGLLLFGVGFCLGKSGICPGICSLSQPK